MGMDPKGVKLSPNGRFLCKANSSLCFKPLRFEVGRYTSTDYGKYHRPVILLYFCVRQTTFDPENIWRREGRTGPVGIGLRQDRAVPE